MLKKYKLHFDGKNYTIHKRVFLFFYVWARYKYFDQKEDLNHEVYVLNKLYEKTCFISRMKNKWIKLMKTIHDVLVFFIA